VAFADPVREMVLALNPIFGPHDYRVADVVSVIGWDAAKRYSGEIRGLLQRMGTEAGRRVLGENVWVDAAGYRICSIFDDGGKVVLTDTRFPNEYEFVRDMGGVVVQVVRTGCEGLNHESEKHYGEFAPDYEIVAKAFAADPLLRYLRASLLRRLGRQAEAAAERAAGRVVQEFAAPP
jgi:hypothetical protein